MLVYVISSLTRSIYNQDLNDLYRIRVALKGNWFIDTRSSKKMGAIGIGRIWMWGLTSTSSAVNFGSSTAQNGPEYVLFHHELLTPPWLLNRTEWFPEMMSDSFWNDPENIGKAYTHNHFVKWKWNQDWYRVNHFQSQEFLTSAGIQVNAPEELPELDPSFSSAVPEHDSGAIVPSKTVLIKKHPLKQFLENDGQVLRQINYHSPTIILAIHHSFIDDQTRMKSSQDFIQFHPIVSWIHRACHWLWSSLHLAIS